jgi:hypothetical protein
LPIACFSAQGDEIAPDRLGGDAESLGNGADRHAAAAIDEADNSLVTAGCGKLGHETLLGLMTRHF